MRAGPLLSGKTGLAGGLHRMTAMLAPCLALVLLAAAPPLADGFDYPVGDADAKGSYVDAASGATHEGWYKATVFGEKYFLGIHPGEDWNGRGGGNTDYGQPVHSIGAGKVIVAEEIRAPWGNVVVIAHRFLDNGKERTVHSLYAHMSRIAVKKGEIVTRRQVIGAIGRDQGKQYPAHLHLEIRTDLKMPTDYWPERNGDDLEKIRTRYVDPTVFIDARRTLPTKK